MVRGSLGEGRGAMVMPSLCQDSVLGVGWGQVKGHVVKSPLSSSFICSSVFETTTCEAVPPCNMVPIDVHTLQFVLHTSGLLITSQQFKQGEIITFSLDDNLRKDIYSLQSI